MGRALATAWLALLATALLCAAGQGPASSTSAGRVLVMPFENQTRDAAYNWLSEGAAVLLEEDTNDRGGHAITRAERQQAFERFQVPQNAVLTGATVIRIAQLVGAEQVVVGTLQREGNDLVVHARSIAIDAGRVQAEVTARGASPNLMTVFDNVAKGVSPAAAGTETDHPPLAAFESYVKGLIADTPSAAVASFNAALALYPRYDRVRIALWEALTDDGNYERALLVAEGVPPGSAVSRRARFLAGLSELDLRRYDDAFGTFDRLAQEQLTPAVENNLGIVQLRRGGGSSAGKATAFFEAAQRADPDDPDIAFNLGYAYWQERDAQNAIHWLREVVRRSPADGTAHFILGTALAATGSTAEATRERELARRLSSNFADWEKRPAVEQVPTGLERVKSGVELPHARQLGTRAEAVSQREQQQLATFYLDRARRLFEQETDRDAVAELNRALYLSPYMAEAHLLLGRIHLRNGRVRDAIDALKISVWSADTAEAHAVLGRAYQQAKDVTNARAEGERALAIDPASVEAKQLLDMLRSP